MLARVGEGGGRGVLHVAPRFPRCFLAFEVCTEASAGLLISQASPSVRVLGFAAPLREGPSRVQDLQKAPKRSLQHESASLVLPSGSH